MLHERRVAAWSIRSGLVRLMAGLCVYAIVMASPVVAEEVTPDDAPVTVSEAEATEPPPPTEIPAPPPTAIPPEPTAVPTEAPPPPTEPPTEPPVEPTGVPDDPPAGSPSTDPPIDEPTGTPTEEPTVIPTDEPAVESELAYTLADEPECLIAPGQPDAIAPGGALEYECISSLALQGSGIVPAGVTVIWDVRAEIDGGWFVQLLPPRNHPDDIVEWTTLRPGEAAFTFDQDDPAGTDTATGEIDRAVEIEFRLRVTRQVCATESQTARIAHDATILSPGAAITDSSPEREPLRITPALQSIPEPAVTFSSALDFGSVGATASGLIETSRTGTLTAEITGLDSACGDWALDLSTTPLINEAGEPLIGASLVVTAVDDVALPDGGCDLASGCTISTMTGGPDTPATTTIALTVTLHMPERASIGAFTTTLDATLRQAGVDQMDDSPEATHE